MHHLNEYKKLRVNYRINSLKFGFDVKDLNKLKILGLDIQNSDPYQGKTESHS
jgi:hypothetical protein